jgi:hypothetical protein
MQVIDFLGLISMIIRNVELRLVCKCSGLNKENVMSIKVAGSRFCNRLTGHTFRILVIRAGFPYHKAPSLYPWLWVFILLPFLDEDSLNELAEKHGKPLRQLYPLILRYPTAFERLVRLLSLPLFFDLLEEFDAANDTAKSRQRLKIIVDDTNAEKFGTCMEFLHKLYDHCHEKYIMGYNYVVVLVVSGSVVFPLGFILWLPKDHLTYRSKNDIVRDELLALQAQCERQEVTLKEVEFLADSAYCVQKVISAADNAGLRVITKPGNTHKFEYAGEALKPRDLIERVATGSWKYLEAHTWYQRVSVQHHVYGDVVLVVRRRYLPNGKIIHDVLLCNTRFYTAVRIHKSYATRWTIELHFKYAKQYLGLGKSQFGKFGSIRSQLACVALAAVVVALFRRQASRTMSFRQAVKAIAQELRDG